MITHANKTQENKNDKSAANISFQKMNSGESTFQLVDNRHETIVQRTLQEMANNKPQAKQMAHLQMKVNNVVQRSDLFDLADESDYEQAHDGPLPILRKIGNGYAFNENFLVEKIQLRGGHGAAHSEVFCIIFRSRYNKGVLRFSRNQAGDTFQRQAKLDQSDWHVVNETDVLSKKMKVKGAESLAEEVHNTMTHYISGDCHDFAYSLYSALITGTVPKREEDSFM